MARHFQHLEVRAEKLPSWRFFDEKIRFYGLDFESESEIAKEITIGNHRHRESVTPDLAAELAFNLRNVLNVIDVPVCQQQKFWMNIKRTRPFAGAIGRVKKNPSIRSFKQIAIGLKNPAAKCFWFRHVESLRRYTVTSA